MKEIKYIILGAGISGLSFASKINSDDYIVLEKEIEPGGLCRTHKVDEYIWDFAGHFFHFKNDETRKYFEPALAKERCIKQVKKTKIFYKGKYIDYPFQKNIHQLDKDDFIDCLYDLYFKEAKEDYISFKDMLLGKFGKGICDRFLVPYNEKLYACDLDTLDKDAMGRFFPYADLKDIISNMKLGSNISYNDIFIYPYEGAGSIIDYLMSKIAAKKVHLGEFAVSIDTINKIVKTNKHEYHFEYLINSIPFNQFNSLIGNENKKLSWNKVLVYNIGFDKPSIDSDIHWIYYPEKDINFYRVGFYNNILNQEKLSIYVELGFNNKEKANIEHEYVSTLENLKKCGVINDHKVVAHESILMDPAYVHISKDSSTYMKKIKNSLEDNNIYTIGRYGDWTYCSMEDCYMQACALAGKIGEK